MPSIQRRVAPLLFLGALIASTCVIVDPASAAVNPPVVTAGGVTTVEGNGGSHTAAIPVTLSRQVPRNVTFSWETVNTNGSANFADTPSDYHAQSGTVTFPPNTTAQTIPVSVKGDNVVEPHEYLIVKLSNAVNGVIGNFPGLGAVVIENDDALIVPGTGSVFEGADGQVDLDVSVTLAQPTVNTVSVQWTTLFAEGAAGDQADEESDYSPTSGSVTFNPGETAKTVTIPVNGDLDEEADEYVIVSFHTPTNAKIGGVFGLTTGTILNDDVETTTACAPDEECESPDTTSNDGTTTLQVTAEGSAGPQVLTVTVGGIDPMLCTLPESGSVVAEYFTTAADAGKVADYTVFGEAADFANAFYAMHTDISGCYGSPDPFNGWSPCEPSGTSTCDGTYEDGPYNYGPAPLNPATGFYEAFLGSCANHGGYQPCFVNISGEGFNTTQIHSPPSASDPRASH